MWKQNNSMIKLMLSEMEIEWMQRILLSISWIGESNASLSEIEAGFMQVIISKCMLYWL